MNKDLIPCPKCENKNIILKKNFINYMSDNDEEDSSGTYYWYECENGHSHGESFASIEEAEKNWNSWNKLYNDIKITLEHLCLENMKEDAYVSEEHDLFFKIFRILSGYNTLLDKMELYKKNVSNLLDFLCDKEDYFILRCEKVTKENLRKILFQGVENE